MVTWDRRRGMFFERQSPLTAAKIKIYEKYITGYLPKIIQTFGGCLIADLFCGAGKNGKEKGSPLVLLDQVEYILTSNSLKKKPTVEVLFNDKEKKNTENLKQYLGKRVIPSEIVIQPVRNEDFQSILTELLRKYSKSKVPKFFFIDPFSYSEVKVANLRDLMSLENTEVFLFMPVWDIYRFSNSKEFKEDHKTRASVEDFTTRGMTDYDGIDDFMRSIKEKLKQQLRLKYVRPMLLDHGPRKNAIFLLTKHQKGMLLMNKIAFKLSDDGKGVNVKQQQSNQLSLLVNRTQQTSKFIEFEHSLEQELRKRGRMSNDEIVDFTIVSEFLPQHAKSILTVLSEENKIKVFNEGEDITIKRKQWNIAEKIRKEVIFIYDN
jgi:three-Cys-motif partner protein